ncbi:MAG: hypothetical protein KatS3mg057_0275 [Herpetosiphonaceae bacterium]|nr:MAG: hypothetical protein KatS3mg057_0275 [Herpetosiphonaceae bacterium]
MAIFEIVLPREDPALQADLAAALVGEGRVEPSRIQPKDIGTLIAVVSGGAKAVELLWRWYQRKRREKTSLEHVIIVTPAGRRFYLREVDLETLKALLGVA